MEDFMVFAREVAAVLAGNECRWKRLCKIFRCFSQYNVEVSQHQVGPVDGPGWRLVPRTMELVGNRAHLIPPLYGVSILVFLALVNEIRCIFRFFVCEVQKPGSYKSNEVYCT